MSAERGTTEGSNTIRVAKLWARAVGRFAKILFGAFAASVGTMVVFVVFAVGIERSAWISLLFSEYQFQIVGGLVILWAFPMWRYLK